MIYVAGTTWNLAIRHATCNCCSQTDYKRLPPQKLAIKVGCYCCQSLAMSTTPLSTMNRTIIVSFLSAILLHRLVLLDHQILKVIDLTQEKGLSHTNDSKETLQLQPQAVSDDETPLLRVEEKKVRSNKRGRDFKQKINVFDRATQKFAVRNVKGQELIKGNLNSVVITKKNYMKKDWCRTSSFRQIVTKQGCHRQTITNRFCYGQCNSFYIPKNIDRDEGDASKIDGVEMDGTAERIGELDYFRSCAYCTPDSFHWITVILRCPKKSPPYAHKRIRVVKKCKCVALKLD